MSPQRFLVCLRCFHGGSVALPICCYLTSFLILAKPLPSVLRTTALAHPKGTRNRSLGACAHQWPRYALLGLWAFCSRVSQRLRSGCRHGMCQSHASYPLSSTPFWHCTFPPIR